MGRLCRRRGLELKAVDRVGLPNEGFGLVLMGFDQLWL